MFGSPALARAHHYPARAFAVFRDLPHLSKKISVSQSSWRAKETAW
jgi:hypothetical protein